MATTTYKVLGQVTGSAANTTLYTVPSATSTVVSTLVIANLAAAGKSYRLMVRPAGASLNNKHYIAYDVAIAANDTTCLTLGMTLAATDVVDVYSSDSNLSFSLFGSEIT